MADIRLIALDLDGTLLTTDKQLSAENLQALEQAAAQGIYIVPTTGRFYTAMPEFIRALPFIRFAITMNGAQVLDTKTGVTLSRAEIPNATAIRLMKYLDTQPVIYDCYKNAEAFMTASMLERAEEYIKDVHFLFMVQKLRRPVPELKRFIAEQGGDLQKVIAFFPDPAFKPELLEAVQTRFPELAVTSSIPGNLEINVATANKGRALLALADRLGIPHESTMAFGDGLNDLSMIKAAGVGVAMANSIPEVLAAADHVTLDNDSSGVAVAMRKYIKL